MDDPESVGNRGSSYEQDYPSDYYTNQNSINESTGLDTPPYDTSEAPGTSPLHIYYDPAHLDGPTGSDPPQPDSEPPPDEDQPPYVPPYEEPEPVDTSAVASDDHPQLIAAGEELGSDGYRNSLPPPPSPLTQPPEKTDSQRESFAVVQEEPATDQQVRESEYRESYMSTEPNVSDQQVRESEYRESYMSNQPPVTDQQVRESEYRESYISTEPPITDQQVRESEYRESYMSNQPPVTDQQVRESEYRESYMSNQPNVTDQQVRESEYRESYMSNQPPEEELTVLYDSSSQVDSHPEERQQPEAVDTTAVAVGMSGEAYSEVRDVIPPTTQDYEAVHTSRTNEYKEVTVNSDERPPSVAEPVVVDISNNNAGKDVTWGAASTSSGVGIQSMAGYSYANNEETIEMVDMAPPDQKPAAYVVKSNPDDDPAYYFKEKSPINMNGYFAVACIGFFFCNILMGSIALALVQKGRNASTPKEARKFGILAIFCAFCLGPLISIAIGLLAAFGRNLI